LLPEVLSRNGFRTAKSGRPLGRWHKRGFDDYPNVSTTHWRKRAFEKTVSRILYDIDPRVGDTVSDIYNTVFGTTGEESDINEVVADVVANIDDEQSTYSFVHWMDTHTPYTAPKGLVDECLDQYEYDTRPLESVATEFPDGSITANSLRPGGVVYEGSEPWAEEGYEPDTQLINARYDAAVRHADAKVGALVSALRDQGVYENTMLVVLSDHGESLGEHGIYYEHHGLYESTVRIPLVVRIPGVKSNRIDDPVSIMDLAPTIYDYLDVEDTPATDGRSLRSLIDGDARFDRTAIIAEEANAQRRRMILADHWKYITALDDGKCRYCECTHANDTELYNLRSDPHEQHNVADDNPDMVAELAARIEEQSDNYSTAVGDRSQSVTYDDEEDMIDRLEALGYR
jgi:arylsulfatase A-like enzyme